MNEPWRGGQLGQQQQQEHPHQNQKQEPRTITGTFCKYHVHHTSTICNVHTVAATTCTSTSASTSSDDAALDLDIVNNECSCRFVDEGPTKKKNDEKTKKVDFKTQIRRGKTGRYLEVEAEGEE